VQIEFCSKFHSRDKQINMWTERSIEIRMTKTFPQDLFNLWPRVSAKTRSILVISEHSSPPNENTFARVLLIGALTTRTPMLNKHLSELWVSTRLICDSDSGSFNGKSTAYALKACETHPDTWKSMTCTASNLCPTAPWKDPKINIRVKHSSLPLPVVVLSNFWACSVNWVTVECRFISNVLNRSKSFWNLPWRLAKQAMYSGWL